MPKLMPSLRHTKSEEHLDSTIPTASTTPKPNGTNCLPTAAVKIHIDRVSDSQTFAASPASDAPSSNHREWNENGLTEDDVWSQEDDEITAQYLKLHKICDRDTVSQMSLDSIDSREQSMIGEEIPFACI